VPDQFKIPAAFGSIVKTVDRAAEMIDCVQQMTASEVLVGIPRANNPRQDGPIGNAAIAYIHEYGSPAHNIPRRAFLHPGVKSIQSRAVAMMRQGALDCLRGTPHIDQVLNRVGLLAREGVVRAITDPNPAFAPLQPATIRARLRRTAAGRRKLKQIKKQGKTLTGWAAEIDEDGTVNIKPLLDTLQLRRAITYVVQKAEAR
jgi:hypothetical protein